jgi:hypothetical protein
MFVVSVLACTLDIKQPRRLGILKKEPKSFKQYRISILGIATMRFLTALAFLAATVAAFPTDVESDSNLEVIIAL